jgi:hypothetical protein
MSRLVLPLRVVSLVALALVLCRPVAAGGDDWEREIRAWKERHQALLSEAEELRAAGKVDRAEQVQREARALGEKIERTVQELKAKERARRAEEERREAGKPQDERREILQGLEQGMKALKRLGRMEEVEHLGRIADEVRRSLAQDARAEPERAEGGNAAGERLRALEARMEQLQRALKELGGEIERIHRELDRDR